MACLDYFKFSLFSWLWDCDFTRSSKNWLSSSQLSETPLSPDQGSLIPNSPSPEIRQRLKQMKAVAGEDRKQLQTTLERQDRQQLVWLLLFKQQPPPSRQGQEHLRGTMLERGAKGVQKGGLTRNAPAQGPCAPAAGSGGSRWQEEDKQDGLAIPKGVRSSWYPASGGPTRVRGRVACRMPFPSAGPFCKQEFCLCRGGGSSGEAFPSCFLQDIPAPPDSWFPLGS